MDINTYMHYAWVVTLTSAVDEMELECQLVSKEKKLCAVVVVE